MTRRGRTAALVGRYLTPAVLALATTGPASAESISLTPLSVAFVGYIGIDYHQPTSTLALSTSYPSGLPGNLSRLASNGTTFWHSTLAGIPDEVKVAAARQTLGGFAAGELFTGNGVDGQIARVSADGTTVQQAWVSLPGANNGHMRGGLIVDDTGVYDYDLIVATTNGEVWRIDAGATPDCSVGCTMLGDTGMHLEGVTIVPNDPLTWGRYAGKILAGDEQRGRMWVFDGDPATPSFYEELRHPQAQLAIEDLDVILPGMNFFGVNYGQNRILGAPAADFTGSVGHILITEEFGQYGTGLWELSYDFATDALVVDPFLQDGFTNLHWEHVTFAPIGVREIPPVPADPVPEPATVLLLGGGIAGLTARSRRRRRA